MNEVEKLDKEIADITAEQDNLSRRRDAAIDKRDKARTASFDKKLVEQARAAGLNPNNFATEEELSAGIKKGIK